jgi:hypothetical protein
MNLNQRKDAKMQMRDELTGARPLGRFRAYWAGCAGKFQALVIVALKRTEVRAPLRLCTFAPLR